LIVQNGIYWKKYQIILIDILVYLDQQNQRQKYYRIYLLDSSEGYSMEYVSTESSKFRYKRGTDKTPIFGIKEREAGKVYAQIMLPDEVGKELTSKQLLAVIEKRCKEGITIMTDDFSSYKALDKPDYTKLLDGLELTSRYNHETACHSSRVYVAPDGVHTNGIESLGIVQARLSRNVLFHVSRMDVTLP
jgi:transposase-like protein